MERIFCDARKCLGCHACVVSCAIEHSQSKELFGAMGEEEKPVPRRAVLAFEEINLSLTCRHCEDAPCIDACITGALHKDASGVVVCEAGKCVGCWMCMMVCRFGLIAPGVIAAKCDMCPDRTNQMGKTRYACVEACPTDALFVGEYEEFQKRLKLRVEPRFQFGRLAAGSDRP